MKKDQSAAQKASIIADGFEKYKKKKAPKEGSPAEEASESPAFENKEDVNEAEPKKRGFVPFKKK